MNDIRSVATIAILVAFGSAIVFNAGKVQPLFREIRVGWTQTIQAISGVNRGV